MTSGVPGSSPPCSIDGCGEPSKTRGWCYRHYRRWWKHGDPEALKRPKSYDGTPCGVSGCKNDAEVQGWCSKHYQRWKANGDPKVSQRRERGSGSITVNGYLITGDRGHVLSNARGLLDHRRVLHEKIGPGEHPCHWCGKAVSWDLSFPASPDALVVDHLDGDGLNNDPTNLVPSCGECNISRA